MTFASSQLHRAIPRRASPAAGGACGPRAARRAKLSRSASIERLEDRRLLAFGKTDVTFADHGRVITTFGDADEDASSDAQVKQLTLMSDGTADGLILAGGDAGLARLDPSGRVDTTFASGGMLKFGGVPGALSFVAQAVDQSSGAIYVLASDRENGVEVMKFSSSGAAVTSFGDQHGTKIVASRTAAFSPRAIAVDGDGHVVVAGTVAIGGGIGARVRLYRLTSGGAYDGSFGSGAISEFQIGSRSSKTPVLFDSVAGVTTTSDGGIVVGGGSVAYLPAPTAYGSATFAVARLTPGGLLDTSYGVGGITHTVYASGGDVTALGFTGVLPTAFAGRHDGSVYLAARGAGSRAVVAEFDAHGTLDLKTQPYDGFPLVKPTGLATLNDGRAVLLGEPASASSHGLVMAAIDPAGGVGHFVYTDDLVKTTIDLRGDTGGAIAESITGRLLIGGAASSGSGGYEVVRFASGRITDPPPDQFLNARTNDIVTDGSGGLHVAYFDLGDHLLKYAYRAPNGLWSSPVVVDPTVNAGQYLSIAVNADRMPSIAYYVGGAGDLRVATTSDRRTWTPQTVDSKGSVGLYPSLAIDALGRPSVTYYQKNKGDLRFAWMKAPNSWGVETIDASGDVGAGSTLALSPNTGRFTVAYVDSTRNAIKWAARKKAGQWLTQTVTVNRHGVASSLSMAYGYYFRPAVSWYQSGVADLRLALFENDHWTVETLSSKGAIGQYSAVVFQGFFDPPEVYCYNRSHDSVSLISVDFDHSADMSDIATGVGRFLSVSSLGADTDLAYLDPTRNAIVIRKAPQQG